MVTRKRQLYLRLINLYVDGIELTAELGRRLAVDLSSDGGAKYVLSRHGFHFDVCRTCPELCRDIRARRSCVRPI
jgi:hypothetical protein